ncbi:MAG TPA: hypothetical protein VJ750_10635 [Rhizomicrobium sp.]|nr:hypothetical protein [Rhizomicrobium sp.]
MTDATTHAGELAAPKIGQLAHCPDSKNDPSALEKAGVPYSYCKGLNANPSDTLVDPINERVVSVGKLCAEAETRKRVKDQAFDPFISLAPDKKTLLISLLLPLCDEAMGRRLGRKATDREKYGLALASVTANALRAAYHPTSTTVHYPRARDFFSGHSDHYPDFMRAITLRNVVDALGTLGFLVLTRGKRERVGNGWLKLQSTFQASKDFVAWLDQSGIAPCDLIRLEGRSPLILRNSRKRDIPYDARDAAILTMVEGIRTYNKFLSQVELSLDLPEAELEKMHTAPERTGDPRPPINFDDKELCRIFNNGSFEQGGRFFRGWWISVPKMYRDHILIDGKPTVEKDYSGCFLRMLYHLEDKPFPEDPYAIPQVKALAGEQELDWKVVRTAIKRLTNIYLNASRKDKIGYFPDITCDLPAGLNRPEQIYALIKEMHKPIAHNFRTGYGVRLMRLESDMCAYVLAKGVREQIPVLPIHDSFRVQRDHGDWLEQAMRAAYQEQLPGFSPEIE